jgi:hypothetical protein
MEKSSLPVRLMRGFRAAERDVGPSIRRNLLIVYGSALIIGVFLFGGMLVAAFAFIGLMNLGDAVLGGKVFSSFMTSYVLPGFAILGFCALMFVTYWRLGRN